ncbi:hypothetical protein GCM10010123_23620 [Pilimelia anulata]|uniref:Uncharacterized protein n=1 Tax=Pilimelia anulata TaxID=53371 RepID=A0A8J3B3G3_9ACTN|nr:hypothetical protein GCM10010123_23620 [Pilimelia anulata]
MGTPPHGPARQPRGLTDGPRSGPTGVTEGREMRARIEGNGTAFTGWGGPGYTGHCGRRGWGGPG